MRTHASNGRHRHLTPQGDAAAVAGAPRPKALVTGGAGFIGSHLSESLLADGWEVWALDDLSTGSRDNVAHLLDDPTYHLVVDTVLHRTVVNELVNKVDVVFHLAAAVGPRLIVERPVHTIVTNLEGSEIVLDHCARFGKRVLVASTSEIYGDHRSPEPLREDARRVYGPTTQKRWLYADSKAMDEYLALAYRQERGLEFVTARLFNTVGPRQSGQYGMVVARFAQAAVSGLPLEIHGDGTQTRTFCHVQDTVRALKGLMDSDATTGEIYNVGSENHISIGELATRVLELTGSKSELVHVPYDQVYGLGIDDMLHRVPAIGKIRAAIGWRPSFDLDRILADVIDWARAARAPVELADA